MSNIKFLYILYKDLKRFFKKHKYILCLIIAFILVFIFNKYQVFAYTESGLVGTTFISYEDMPTWVKSAIESCPEYNSGNYYTLFGGNYMNGRNNNTIYFIPKTDNLKLYISNYNADGGRAIITASNTPVGNCVFYRLDDNTTTPYSRTTQTGVNMWVYRVTTEDMRFYSDLDVYSNDTFTTLYYDTSINSPQNPYILNTVADLTGLLSDTITIDAGDFDDYPIKFTISQGQLGDTNYYTVYSTTLNRSSPFFNSPLPNYVYYDIPISVFKKYLINGSSVNYSISQEQGGDFPYVDTIRTIYTPTLSEETDTDKINNIINNNTSLILGQQQQMIQQQQQILQQEQEQTDTAKDTNNFLKDDSFSSDDLIIPTDTTEDITENGINNIFNMIYNGFTSGQATDVVVPIPFTNKSFTINSNLTYNVLNSNGFSWLKTTIEAFWWYIISRFIVKDISKKINKIKSGDFENIETNNIKEDML